MAATHVERALQALEQQAEERQQQLTSRLSELEAGQRRIIELLSDLKLASSSGMVGGVVGGGGGDDAGHGGGAAAVGGAAVKSTGAVAHGRNRRKSAYATLELISQGNHTGREPLTTFAAAKWEEEVSEAKEAALLDDDDDDDAEAAGRGGGGGGGGGGGSGVGSGVGKHSPQRKQRCSSIVGLPKPRRSIFFGGGSKPSSGASAAAPAAAACAHHEDEVVPLGGGDGLSGSRPTSPTKQQQQQQTTAGCSSPSSSSPSPSGAAGKWTRAITAVQQREAAAKPNKISFVELARAAKAAVDASAKVAPHATHAGGAGGVGGVGGDAAMAGAAGGGATAAVAGGGCGDGGAGGAGGALLVAGGAPAASTTDAAAAAAAEGAASGEISSFMQLVSTVQANQRLQEKVGANREERLKDFLSQDRDVESLLTSIREKHRLRKTAAEAHAEWLKRHPAASALVLLPDTRRRLLWDVWLLGVAVVSVALEPYSMGFLRLPLLDHARGTFLVELSCDALLLVDVGLCLLTAYSAEDHLIRRPAATARQYASSWMVVDLLAALPLSLLLHVAARSGAFSDEALLWLQLLKLLHVLRLCRLPRALSTHHGLRHQLDRLINLQLQELVTIVLGCVLLFHVLGSCYYLVVRVELVRYSQQLEAGGGVGGGGGGGTAEVAEAVAMAISNGNLWMPPPQFLPLGNMLGNSSGYYDGTGNGVDGGGSDNGGFGVVSGSSEAYFFSFWWALCATIGSAVPIPFTLLQSVYTTLVVFVGFLSYAGIIGSFTTTLSQMSAASAAEKQRRDYIDQYLRYKKIPRALRASIQQYYVFAGFDEKDDLLADLPITLRLQLDLVIYRNLFLKVPFFQTCDIGAISVIVPHIQREYAWPGKTLVQEGEVGRGLFLIDRGFVRVTREGATRGILTTPGHFGEGSLLGSTRSRASVTSVTLTQLLTLDKDEFEAVLELYPQMKKALLRHVKLLQRKYQKMDTLYAIQYDANSGKGGGAKGTWHCSMHGGAVSSGGKGGGSGGADGKAATDLTSEHLHEVLGELQHVRLELAKQQQLLTARDTADLLREVQDLEQRVRAEHFRQVSAHLHVRTSDAAAAAAAGGGDGGGGASARRGGRGAGSMLGASVAKTNDAVAPGDFSKPSRS